MPGILLLTLGLLMRARDVLDLWRKVAWLSQSQREAISLRVRDQKSGLLKMPGDDALNDVLAAVDPSAYARALTAWLQANAGVLPRSLALDGKSVGDGRCGMIITLCRHEDERPVAMIPASGKKEDGEVSEARALLSDPQMEWVHALVTADPLHNKQATAILPETRSRLPPLGTGRALRRQFLEGQPCPPTTESGQGSQVHIQITKCRWCGIWRCRRQGHAG